MCLALHTLSDDNIDRVLADPPLIWRVIAAHDPEAYREARGSGKPGLIARLFGARDGPQLAEPPPLSRSDGEFEETDLDKAWHGIHYLLTGTAWEGEAPLSFLLCGGTEVGDIDAGYGPVRTMKSDAVRAVSAALAVLDQDTLRKRFDAADMTRLEIYPDIWERDPAEDDTLGYCLEYYEDLRKFLRRADAHGMGIVIYVC